MKKLVTLFVVVSTLSVVHGQLIKRDFLTGYSANQDLEKGTYNSTTQGEGTPIMMNQWSLSGKADANNQNGANPKTDESLFFTGYAESGVDVSIKMEKLETGGRTSIYSIASDNTYGAGTYYLALMINLKSASMTTATDFVSFDGNYTGNAQRVRLTVKAIDETNYQLGVSGDTSPATTFSTKTLNMDQTHLVVIKATIDGTGAGNSWIFINPEITGAEPSSADASAAITGTALKSLRGIVIRQRSTYDGHLGGFRLASSWSSVLGEVSGLNGIFGERREIVVTGNEIITNAVGQLKVYSLSGTELISALVDGSYTTNLNNGLYIVRFTDTKGTVSSAKIQIR
ncbi:MAG: T9SS type A sorting domain-containing protein [Paludibacter sp.]|jgi:hypothetical protein|nr:T9SS type A sorting domain-containing protein [Paludibacter sp.]